MFPARVLRFPTATNSTVTLRWRDGRSTKVEARGEIRVDEDVAVVVDVQDHECLDDIEGCAPDDIQILNVALPRADNAALAKVSHLTHLIVLKVFDASGLSDDGARDLASLTGLRELRLNNARKVSDNGFEAICGLSRLTHLFVTQTRISDDGLANLKRLPNLESLHLDGNWKVRGDGLEHLGQLSRLETLWVQIPSISDRDVAHLSGLTNLRLVGLPDQLTADAFRHLPRNPGLRIALRPNLSNERIRELAEELPHLDFGIRWTEFDPSTASIHDILVDKGLRFGPLPDPHAPVLVMFTGDDCEPCDELRPSLKQISALHPNRLGIFEIDAGVVPAEAAALHVTSVPTFVLFANGRPIVRFSATTRDEILAEVSPHIGVATKASDG